MALLLLYLNMLQIATDVGKVKKSTVIDMRLVVRCNPHRAVRFLFKGREEHDHRASDYSLEADD